MNLPFQCKQVSKAVHYLHNEDVVRQDLWIEEHVPDRLLDIGAR
jgi:hypothetical protein